MANLRPIEIILIVLLIVLLFGAKKLPDLARGVGRSLKIFKSEVSGLVHDDAGDTADGTATGTGTGTGRPSGTGEAPVTSAQVVVATPESAPADPPVPPVTAAAG